MISDNLLEWFPRNPPIYDIHKTYVENAQQGPFFVGKIPQRNRVDTGKDFLGYPIASAVGVPAGPLLNARWVKLAAELGYDVLTYKTIRSEAYPAHPLPNMVYVNTCGMLSAGASSSPVTLVDAPSSYIEDLAVTNSFGMPSMSPSFLQEDIPKAKSYLRKGQVLVVSIVGTERQDLSFTEDFVRAALLAKECGAPIIEANFSCPNVDKKAGCLYMSPEVVLEMGSRLVKAIAPIPLIIKVGLFSSKAGLRDVMISAAKAGIRGVSGINTISRSVVNDQGVPALGATRLSSGICGGPIRKEALAFMQDAAEINVEEKLGLTLIGVGGITLPEHFSAFFQAGADVAMTATGMMWDPFLALRFHNNIRKVACT